MQEVARHKFGNPALSWDWDLRHGSLKCRPINFIPKRWGEVMAFLPVSNSWLAIYECVNLCHQVFNYQPRPAVATARCKCEWVGLQTLLILDKLTFGKTVGFDIDMCHLWENHGGPGILVPVHVHQGKLCNCTGLEETLCQIRGHNGVHWVPLELFAISSGGLICHHMLLGALVSNCPQKVCRTVRKVGAHRSSWAHYGTNCDCHLFLVQNIDQSLDCWHSDLSGSKWQRLCLVGTIHL